MNQTSLPEENQALNAAATASTEVKEAVAVAGGQISSAKEKIVDEAQKLKGKASEKASEYAAVGKDKASDALEGLSRLLRDAAGSVDERLGENYGQYARKTADVIAGAATSLREKDLSAVTDDAREFVRKSPVVAVGIAAAAGFVLARMLKSGNSKSDTEA